MVVGLVWARMSLALTATERGIVGSWIIDKPQGQTRFVTFTADRQLFVSTIDALGVTVAEDPPAPGESAGVCGITRYCLAAPKEAPSASKTCSPGSMRI